MQVMLALCASCALGCALPKVALGGRVSLGETGGELERRTVHSALWVAVSYSARTRADEVARERPSLADTFEEQAVPCAIDVACAWEREAAYEASWGRTSEATRQAPGDEAGL
jgi:hypothetical protein